MLPLIRKDIVVWCPARHWPHIPRVRHLKLISNIRTGLCIAVMFVFLFRRAAYLFFSLLLDDAAVAAAAAAAVCSRRSRHPGAVASLLRISSCVHALPACYSALASLVSSMPDNFGLFLLADHQLNNT